MYKVRVRNIEYPLSGSMTMDDGKTIKWSLPPGQWVTVDEPVYKFLEQKFKDPRSYEVPAALPNEQGSYNVPPTHTRWEQAQQYLIEFSKS